MPVILFILILIFYSNANSEEGKQENILKIEKSKEKSLVIQTPLEPTKFSTEEELLREQKRIKLKKPKIEKKPFIIQREMSEAEKLVNAWRLYEFGLFHEAKEKFREILTSINKEVSLSARLGLAYSLKNLNQIDEALDNFEYLYSQNYKTDEVIINIVDLLIVKEEFERAEKYALPICLKPYVFFDYAKKLTFEHQKEKAKEKFLKLLPCSENDIDLRIGILYELVSLSSYEEMLKILREEKKKNDLEYISKINQLELNLHRERLSKLDILSDEVRKIAEEILMLVPEDKSAKSILAWHNYKKKNYEEALRIFSVLNRRYPTEEEFILGMAYCYNEMVKEDALIEVIEKSEIRSENLNLLMSEAYIKRAEKSMRFGDYSEAFSTVYRLSRKESEISKAKAAQWYCNQGFSTLASHVDSLNREACYYKEQFPHFEIGLFTRFKSGDRGFSKIREFGFPLSFNYPIKDGQKISFSIYPRHLKSGNLPENSYMGKYYKYLNGAYQKNEPVTSKWIFNPEIVYEKEGYPYLNFALGTTPINGTSSPMLTFSLDVNFKDFWFNLHQSSVNESILSLQGQRDPYSNEKWGRVLKTGVRLGKNISFTDSYWLALSGDFNYIWGENTWENCSFKGNISFGKTFILDSKRELDLGFFYVFQHFRRNSSFFTFGHGGYFSPQIFHIIGPTLRYKIKDCCGFKLDLKTSLGYLYYRSDSSPHYPKFSENTALFSSRAVNDILGYYEGEKKSKIGGSFEMKYKKDIAKNMTLFINGKGDVSGGYNEWSIATGLIYYFLP